MQHSLKKALLRKFLLICGVQEYAEPVAKKLGNPKK
jgi:hypothetical protein